MQFLLPSEVVVNLPIHLPSANEQDYFSLLSFRVFRTISVRLVSLELGIFAR